MIIFQGVSKEYKTNHHTQIALHEISFKINPKEFVSLVGKSGAGKTTLIEKVVIELKHRGYRVGTIKHHSHSGFDIDIPGKDSWRFAQAGSDHIVISAPDKIASYKKVDRELSLDEISATMADVDIILVEGYRKSNKPMIEILRMQNSKEFIGSPELWIALVADFPITYNIPKFGLNDINGIVTLVERKFLAA